MRGKAKYRQYVYAVYGITPAHAGKSTGEILATSIPKDHPRACGEKLLCGLWSMAIIGSPPRMRGKDRHERKAQYNTGITPAHAGKSRW